jgi:hypothetical protein
MTDDASSGDATPQLPECDFMQRYRDYERRAAELHPANKASLFAALRAAGVRTVIVTFDGYGDSGQIEDIVATAGDDAALDLPATQVELRTLNVGQDEPSLLSQPLTEAIETLAYALLGLKHGGWENNDGAFGDFTFDVAEETIVLDYNERFSSSENHTHEF